MEVYVLNMPQRHERLKSIEQEFHGKDNFSVHIVTPVRHAIPRVSHWLTFKLLTEQAKSIGQDCFVFCEDDHIFTKDYDEQSFYAIVQQANELKADVLMGGVSWMASPLQVSDHLFWLESFNGTQFVIVFSRCYDKILCSNWEEENVVTDFHISSCSENIFVMYPFISMQRDFGYSDVTSFNNKEGYVKGLFDSTSVGLSILNKVRNFYHGLQ